AGPRFKAEAVRVGLDQGIAALAIADFVLVYFARLQPRNEQLPHAARPMHAHGMYTTVPMVEVAYHTDTLGIGRPHCETYAADAVLAAQVRAECLVGFLEPAFAEEVQLIGGN